MITKHQVMECLESVLVPTSKRSVVKMNLVREVLNSPDDSNIKALTAEVK